MRPTLEDTFLEIVELYGKRGTCDRGRNGALIVRENRIISTGYVGSPKGFPHCDDVGHLFQTLIREGTETKHCYRTVHAEMNAICMAAKYGISVDGATLFTKLTPCFDCAKAIVSCGIKKVVCSFDYQRSELSKDLFNRLGIELVIKNIGRCYE
jgi:dCMP deaminase